MGTEGRVTGYKKISLEHKGTSANTVLLIRESPLLFDEGLVMCKKTYVAPQAWDMIHASTLLGKTHARCRGA